MTVEQVKADLKEIKYYYQSKDRIDGLMKQTGVTLPVVGLVEKYNGFMNNAPIQHYFMYVNLYVLGKSRKEFADELCYAPEYLRKLIRQTVYYIAENIN